MFWYVVLMLFSPLYLFFGLVFRSEQARLVLALHHQVLILQRQLGKRPSLVPTERLALVLSSLLLGKERLREALLVVKPEALVGWHRAIVRRHWRLLSRRKPGRPPEITLEMEQLVLRILKQHGLTPERRHSVGLGWLQFLGHYGQFIWAGDFCTVTTATLRTYYLVFFLEIGTRRILHWNVSTFPDEVWVSQQFRNLSVVSDDFPRYLIHDRDSKYTSYADSLLEDAGTKVIRLPVRSPDLNGYAERWIRSLRQECLDRIIILNEAHLRWVLQEYVRYYNERRPHRTLGLHVPAGPRDFPTEGEVACRRVLGGLVNDHYRKAA